MRRAPSIPVPTFVPKPAVDTALDWVFFIIGGVAAVWLAYLLFKESFTLGWWQIAFVVVFWLLLAYLVLPRLHRILTRIYVPDYFIGRARTSDGLLGDPVNLALLGSEPQVHEVMGKAGWTLADDLSLATGLEIVKSTVMRRSYHEAPVSPLLLFGRKQDFAYQQEVGGDPGKRHHVRFWRCPPEWMLPGGHHVDWLAAGTYDKSVGFSLFTLQVTHKIDEHTDDERDHIVATVTGSNRRAKVTVIKDFSTGYHARNGGGDTIITDGDLPIVDVRRVRTVPGALGEEPTDSRTRRPAPIIVGAVLLLFGALASLLYALGVVVNWDTISGGLDNTGTPVVMWVAAGFYIVAGLAELFLAWHVFLGSNWARVFALVLNTITLVSQFIGVEFGGERLSLENNLASVSLDILLLLALSSQRATTYARSPRKVPKRVAGKPAAI